MFAFWGLSFAYYLVLFILFRLGFLFAFGESSYDFSVLLKSFYLGAKFDFKNIVLILLPYFLFTLIPQKFAIKKIKSFMFALSSLIFVFFMWVYYSDIGHYAYLKTRLTAPSVLDNTANPLIALEMMWQSYPLVWIVLSFIILCVGWQWFFKKYFLKKLVVNFKNKKTASLKRIALFFAIALFVYGKVSYYPLRWSDAFFSKDKFICQLTMNPFLSFIETLRHRDLKFNKTELESTYERVADFLGVEQAEQNKTTFNFERNYTFESVNSDRQQPNIIVIVMESMASDKTSLSGNPLDPTPVLKEIAKESVHFSSFYTPTEATARGVFATLTSIPDVVNKKSSSRNPLFVDHLTVMDQLKGYKRNYFLGGSASWANIRSLFTSNIKDINIYEEGSYDAPRVDVWGISDIDLFMKAHEVQQKQFEQGKSFVSFIQTSGFHRPYTIPEASIKRGFKLSKVTDAKKISQYGFDSKEQLDSIRLQDFSLGEFFKELKKSEYGKNTVVAIIGDHGLPTKQSLHVKKGFYKHRLVHHKVPLVLYYPKGLSPRVDNKTLGSQVDVFPTLAHVAGINYKTRTIGRSLLLPRKPQNNRAFIFSWHRNPRLIGMVEEEFYYEDAPDYQKLFKYKSQDPLKDVQSDYPSKFQDLKDLTRGLYETSLYLLENNKK